MKAYTIIEKGTGKQVSEDCVLLGDHICVSECTWSDFTSDSILVALADGVGGNAGGAEAAQFVLEEIRTRFAENRDLTEEKIRHLLVEINEHLIETAAKSPNIKNMATTLTGLYCCGESACYFHIGNTRLYAVQGCYLRQVTVDHSTKEWLRRTGQFEALANCHTSEITACMGGGNPAFGQALQVIPINGWREMRGWVLTSDGIHDYVNDDEIDLLSCDEAQIEDICSHVMQDAIDNGSGDDKSIVVIRRGSNCGT